MGAKNYNYELIKITFNLTLPMFFKINTPVFLETF